MKLPKQRNKERNFPGGAKASASSARSWTFAHFALIVLVGGIIYSNTMTVPFVFDDQVYILSTVAFKDLRYFAGNSLADAAIASGLLESSFRTRLVAFFTFALNYRIHGLSVFGYHLFNNAIHIGNALLVYWLVLLTFRTPFFQTVRESMGRMRLFGAALLASLFFISHPIQTQAVTYLSQRFTSLAAFFCLLSLAMYVRARLAVQDSGSPGSSALRLRTLALYGFSVAATVLAMKTKEIAFTFPLVITLYEFFFFAGERKVRLLALLPFLLTMLIIPLTLMGDKEMRFDLANLARSLAGRGQENLALNYLFTQFRVIVTYLRLLVLPVNQNVDYDYPIYNSFFRPEVYLSFLFLLVLLGTAVYLYHRSRQTGYEDRVWLRLISFGTFWFFIMLSVESTVLPLDDVIFEHRLYLPSVGIFLAVAAAMEMVWKRTTPEKRKGIVVLLALVVGLWSMLAYDRNGVWGDKATLWADTVRKSSAKARPHINLGTAYLEDGRNEDAMREFEKAARIDSKSAVPYRNLGIIQAQRGDFKAAMKAFQRAISIQDDEAEVHSNLGIAYEKLNLIKDAERESLRALSMKADLASAHSNLGLIYIKQNRLDEAVVSLRSAVRLDPGYSDFQYNLGIALEAKGDLAGAATAYQKALSLEPQHSQAQEKLARILRLLEKRISPGAAH